MLALPLEMSLTTSLRTTARLSATWQEPLSHDKSFLVAHTACGRSATGDGQRRRDCNLNRSLKGKEAFRHLPTTAQRFGWSGLVEKLAGTRIFALLDRPTLRRKWKALIE